MAMRIASGHAVFPNLVIQELQLFLGYIASLFLKAVI